MGVSPSPSLFPFPLYPVPVEHAHGVGEGADRAVLARTIMRRQARLGLRIALVFVLILVGLPLLNLYLPEAMATRVGGFSITWLLLAVLFYPVTWLLSWLFVRGSDRVEDEIAREYRGVGGPPASLTTPSPTAPPSGRASLQGEPSPERPKRKLFVEDDEA